MIIQGIDHREFQCLFLSHICLGISPHLSVFIRLFKKSVVYLPLYCILDLSKLKHPVDAHQNKPQLIGSSLQRAWSKILVFSPKTSVNVSWQFNV